MAGDLGPPRPPSPDQASDDVRAYLAAISARLPGPRRWRTELMTELFEGLVDAAEYYRELGNTRRTAEAMALRESGPVETVAASYGDLLRGRQARRTAAALLLSGPLIGACWLISLAPGQTPDALLLRYPPLAPIVVVATAAATLTLASTGRLRRWLPDAPSLPGTAVSIACLATVACDVAILAAAAALILDGAAAQPAALTLAAAASCTRLLLSQHAARRGLAAARS